MKTIDNKPYHSLNHHYHQLFNEKTYKIALDIGSTCPNRDGSKGINGCIFCSDEGSGDFATSRKANLYEQVDLAIEQLKGKYQGNSFIAYLQSFTNTYGDSDELMAIYEEILSHPKVVGLSIGTRPDCLDERLVERLSQLALSKPIWIELGLQSIHSKSAQFIRRSYPLEVFDQAVSMLNDYKIPSVVHLIAGLPSESLEDFIESVIYISKLTISGVKFHLLHVLKGTDLGDLYLRNPFTLLDLDTYCQLIVRSIGLLPEEIVIHRLTGDAPRDLLIAPKWSLNKRKVLNTIHQLFKEKNIQQGKLIGGSYER